jgi:hypothetical protein
MVEILDIIPTQHLHQFADAILGMRCRQQMHMIGHQNIGVDIATVLFSGCLELFQKKPVILVCAKDFLAIITTLDHMLRLAWNNKTG